MPLPELGGRRPVPSPHDPRHSERLESLGELQPAVVFRLADDVVVVVDDLSEFDLRWGN